MKVLKICSPPINEGHKFSVGLGQILHGIHLLRVLKCAKEYINILCYNIASREHCFVFRSFSDVCRRL